MKLKKSFYSRDTAKVARELIGKILCRKLPDGLVLKAVITETEAYLGIKDRACHTFGGRRTMRTEAMWGDAGRAYVYLIYGMHYCLNTVTRKAGVPEAVLIRGAVPLQSSASIKKWMLVESDVKKWNRMMAGPGRLCKVLKIDKTLNFSSLQSSDLWIEDRQNVPSKEIVKTPRIGIDYTLNDPAGSHQWPLRFFWRPAADTKKSKAMQNENIFGHNKDDWKNSSNQNAKNRKKSSGRNPTQT